MTRRRCRLLTGAMFVTIGVVGAGCAAPRDPVMAPPAGAGDPLVEYPQIVATDNLAYWLLFDEPNVTSSAPDRPMEVITGVRLARDAPLAIQYSYQFFDASGRPLTPPDRWQWMHLDPRVQYHLRGNAMETRATDWRLHVRSAR